MYIIRTTRENLKSTRNDKRKTTMTTLSDDIVGKSEETVNDPFSQNPLLSIKKNYNSNFVFMGLRMKTIL